MRREMKFVAVSAVLACTSAVAALGPSGKPPPVPNRDTTAVEEARLLAEVSDWSAPAEVGEFVEWHGRRWTVVGTGDESLILVEADQRLVPAPAAECRVIGMAVRDGAGEVVYRKQALR
jgi:hypothetical protein